MGVKGYCQNFSIAFAWNREWKQLKLNAFEACMTSYFLINLCYECDGHVTRQTGSDRQGAKFALGKPWAYQQARLPIHSRDFRHSSYLNVKLSPCLWSRSSSSYSGTNIYLHCQHVRVTYVWTFRLWNLHYQLLAQVQSTFEGAYLFIYSSTTPVPLLKHQMVWRLNTQLPKVWFYMQKLNITSVVLPPGRSAIYAE